MFECRLLVGFWWNYKILSKQMNHNCKSPDLFGAIPWLCANSDDTKQTDDDSCEHVEFTRHTQPERAVLFVSRAERLLQRSCAFMLFNNRHLLNVLLWIIMYSILLFSPNRNSTIALTVLTFTRFHNNCQSAHYPFIFPWTFDWTCSVMTLRLSEFFSFKWTFEHSKNEYDAEYLYRIGLVTLA